MPTSNGQFLMSTEIECLTAVPAHPERANAAIERLLNVLFQLAPAVHGTVGIFTPYGKVYRDVGAGAHLELAAIECDSPYLLAQVVDRQLQLISRALARLKEEGCGLLLAGNNHDGLLQNGCSVWGAHENFLVEQHPTTFGDRMLPFLVTRIFAGAGGIHFPSAEFLAAIRPIAIEQATGGGTTNHRAIHSTARDENHMGPRSNRYRYHLILGDGHRCQFNLALQFAATALALKVALFDPELPDRLKKIRAFRRPNWVQLLHQCNLLARPAKPLVVHPLVIETQRLYLELAERYVDRLESPHLEAHRWLADWRETLDALERMDRPWLAARLDTFAKYEFYSSVLADAGCSWSDLPSRPDLFKELALLDHSYHEFGNADSVFCRLERAGLLDHRVGPAIAPGNEPEPFVPETSSRAQARARFIRDHAREPQLRMDWSFVANVETGQVRSLHDPFAADYSPWSPSDDVLSASPPVSRLRRRSEVPDQPPPSILKLYERGNYQLAEQRLESDSDSLSSTDLRYRAWVRARLGYDDAARWLDRLYRDTPLDLVTIGDYCCVWRFCGLAPCEKINVWIDRGREFVDPFHVSPDDPVGAVAYRDHFAATLLDRGENETARQLLEAACEVRRAKDRILARMLGSLAVACRRLGHNRSAQTALDRAEEIQQRAGYVGDAVDFTLTERARNEVSFQSAMECLAQVASVQTTLGNHMGLTRTLLLQARFSGRGEGAEENRQQVLRLRDRLPALAGCPLLAKILDRWDDWIGGETPSDVVDSYWGL